MYLQEIKDILDGQFVQIKYDCDGGFERCGREWKLKFKYAKKNFASNGKHVCRQCTLTTNNPASKLEVREKMKKTCLEKYGTPCGMNTKENTEKRLKKMFGTQEAIYQRNEKIKKTNQQRYGADHIMKTDLGIQKLNESMQEKYGVNFALQNEQIKLKMQQTNLDKYGVENIGQLPETQIKMAKTMLEKYGVEHYNELPEMKEYLRQHCPEWLKESWENPWAKGIIRPEEWNQKQRETVTTLILNGKWATGHKNSWRGYYNSLGKCKRKSSYFRSGFELLYHYHLDHSDDVDWYDYEPFSIKYFLKEKTHNYIPDFLVKFKKDQMLHIKEVKADYLHDSLETLAKYDAAREFVKHETNMTYEVLLKENIDNLKLDFEEIKSKPNVFIIHDPTKK